MSAAQLRLSSFILKELYGEIVEKVGLNILRKGWSTIGSVKHDTGLAISKIKRALCVLIQHNLVKFQKNARGQITYSAIISNILTIHHYPKLTYCAKMIFGDAAELIIEELLQHGSMTMSSVVANVTNRLLDPALCQSEQIDYHHVASQFEDMVHKHLIKRVLGDNITMISGGDEEEAQLGIIQAKDTVYDLPLGYKTSVSGKRKAVSNDDGPAAKRRKSSNEQVSIDFKDAGISWQVNVLQFYHYLVNEMIENSVRNRLDECAAEIVKVMLKLTILSRDGFNSQTKPVSIFDIYEKLSGNFKFGHSEITQYLSLLEDDEIGFVSKSGEESGGMYVVNIKKSMEAICTHCIESVVRERCGSKSLRIFKLLMLKQHLEQKQVEDMIMVPAKEAKELLYNLMSEKFVNLQEVPRATDYAPSRTFYLFSVNIPQVCRMLLDRSYKLGSDSNPLDRSFSVLMIIRTEALSNLISRRHHDTEEHKRLVEKSEKINATILGLKSQGIDDNSPAVQEVEEMMTDQEKQQLTKLKTVLSKLEQSELQVGDTVLTFTQFLALHC